HERQMIIRSTLRLALLSPTADLAVRCRFRIQVIGETVRNGLLKPPPNAAIVSPEIRHSIRLRNIVGLRRHHMDKVGNPVLLPAEEVGIEAKLEEGSAFGLLSKLGIGG